MSYLRLIDPLAAAMVIGLVLLSAWAGYEICGATHKRRGLEVDRPVTDVLPMPPPPIVVPDHVPPEWEDEDEPDPALDRR